MEQEEDENDVMGMRSLGLVDVITLRATSTNDGENSDEDESQAIHPKETFWPGVVPFSAKVVNTMLEASQLLLRKEPMGNVCIQVPLEAPLKMRKLTYVVDLQAVDDPKDIYVDLHGAWGCCSGQMAYYSYTPFGIRKVDANGKLKKGQAFDVKMTKHRYLHEATGRKLRKYVFVAQNPNMEYLRWGLVSYQWHCDPFTFKPPAHGNSTKNFRPYQPTKRSVRNRIKELSLFYSPEKAVSEYLMEKGADMSSACVHDLPRDPKQVSNSGRFPRSMHRAAAQISKSADSLIRQFPSNEKVYSVMDETMSSGGLFSYTVTKLGPGEFSCNCEEFTACSVCRHSLAVARLYEEGKKFLDNVAERMFPANDGEQEVVYMDVNDLEGEVVGEVEIHQGFSPEVKMIEETQPESSGGGISNTRSSRPPRTTLGF